MTATDSPRTDRVHVLIDQYLRDGRDGFSHQIAASADGNFLLVHVARGIPGTGSLALVLDNPRTIITYTDDADTAKEWADRFGLTV